MALSTGWYTETRMTLDARLAKSNLGGIVYLVTGGDTGSYSSVSDFIQEGGKPGKGRD